MPAPKRKSYKDFMSRDSLFRPVTRTEKRAGDLELTSTGFRPVTQGSAL